jgi:CheY-like chemotaxis protein
LTTGAIRKLDGLRCLILDDNSLIALDLAETLVELGGAVVGPAFTLAGARQLIEREPIDAALLDITIGSAKSWPIADDLVRRNIPFMFLTGYGQLDEQQRRYPQATSLSKPYTREEIRDALLALGLASRG